MKKRILSLLLCVIMTLSLLPVGALAVESAEAEWTPSGGEKATGTFAEALAAMTSGGSIKLLTDVSTAVATKLPAKEISLDLGGKTWTIGDRTQIPRSGTLNLADTGTGGKILSTGPSFTVETGGKLNLSGGTIAHNSAVNKPALCNSGTVTMSGGTIARSGYNVEAVENNYRSSFTMTGGKITNAAGDGIKNSDDLTITGGSITAKGSGVLNNNMYAIATITGGSIVSTNGYGIFNRSGTLYLGGTASVTATAQSTLYTMADLYLSGTPALTKGTDTRAHQIYGNDDTIVASNGKADGALAYYTGDALDIYFPSSFPANKALVSGLENAEQAKKFNITIGTSNNMMEPVYDDTAKNIIAKAKIYTITYKDRAKLTGGANFSGTHGANAPTTYTAGIKATLVAPTKEGYTFDGWYQNDWGSTDKATTELNEYAYGEKTFYAKWSKAVPDEKTATPNLTRTIDAASGQGNVYFGLQEGSEYQEHVAYKLYTTADGNDMPDGITVKDEWRGSIKISPITTSTDYWLTATEDGKLESERVKISARAQYTGLDENGYLVIKTPQELADYLNYCEPGAATVSGSTVTFAKDVPLLYDIYFAGNFEGALDLHGFTATVHDGFAFCVEETETNVKFTLKGGGKVAAEDGMYAIAQEAGEIVVENTTLMAGEIAIFSFGGTLSLTDVTVTVPNTEVTDSATLFITPNTNLTIHSGTFTNGNSGGYTYYSQPGSETSAKTLASCIANGSTSVPTDSMATGTKYQICTAPITVTKGGGGQPLPPDGILSAPLSQDEVDSAFGAGNATFVSPGTITINKDLVLEDSIEIETDVTIDLDGKNVTVKDSSGNENGKPAFIVTDGATLTVKGSGTITGGKGSGTGTGGSAIDGTGNGSVVIGGGASVIGGSGGGTNGSGGDGVKTENGNITVNKGSVTGGSGSGSGTGGNGASSSGSGNIIINAGGSAIGGAGGTSDGTNAGGTGGAGTATAGGNTTANGNITGGNGGNGKGSGNGGTGGAGANENGTISGNGTITGGNGGNIPDGGSGTPGSGGGAITGGGSAASPGPKTKDGGKGVKASAKVTTLGDTPAVSVPEQQLVDAAVSNAERADNTITGIQVTLTVERKDDKPNAGAVEGAKPAGSTVGLYLDITLEKKVTKTGGTTDTTMVTNAEKPIAITLIVPEDMWGGSGYALMCVHDGTAENLGGIYNEASHTLTAQSDKFSTYAIAYTPKSVTPPVDGYTPPTYTPEIPAVDHGSVTVSPKNPAKGDKVTVTVTPDPGYEAGQITVTDKDGKNVPVTRNADGSFSFIQPQGAVKIAATMRLAWNPFGDVKVGDWFHDSVKYVYESGLMAGMDAQTFAPNSGTSRAMIVTILWRMQGEPKAKAASDFVDVPAGAWYSEAIAWAQEQNLAAGVDATHFEPNRDISRQELASLFYRYAVLAKLAPTGAWQVPLTYADKSKIADWAVEGAMFAQLKGFIKGRPGNIFAPNDPATRAEASSMLQRFITAK